MRKAWLPVSIFALWILALTVTVADAASYHVSAFVFDPGTNCKPAGECEGKTDVCKYLFTPPQVYVGIDIVIPKTATVFGVVAVTDGRTCKVIPLFRWSDDGGKTHCGCHGPTPQYARHKDSEEKLLKSILDALKKK